MARITVEDCLEHVPNRFALVHVASQRMRQLIKKEVEPLVECDNKEAVTALREIAAGKVRLRENLDAVLRAYVEEMKHRWHSYQ